jgi:uncharacterized protein (DUF1697 family)
MNTNKGSRRAPNLHTDFLVPTEEEWKRIIADNPFRGEAKRDVAHLVVMFLKRAPKGFTGKVQRRKKKRASSPICSGLSSSGTENLGIGKDFPSG